MNNPEPDNLRRSKSSLVLFIVSVVLLVIVGGYLGYARNLAQKDQPVSLEDSETTISEDVDQITQAEKSPNILTYEKEEGGKIYLYNIETKQTEELKLIDEPKPSDPTISQSQKPGYLDRRSVWSPNGQYLAYQTVTGGVVLYNPADKTNKKLNSVLENPDYPFMIDWSSNSQFFTIELGSGGPSVVTVINIASDKPIGNHTAAFATSPYWNKDGKQFLVTSPRDIGLEERSHQVQNGEYTLDLNLVQVNKDGTKETVLKSGNDLTSYRAYGWTEDGKVRYIKNSYKSRVSSEYTSSYWIYNENGEDLKIEEDRDFSFGRFPKISNLPNNIKLHDYSARLSSDGQWVTFMTAYPSKIYLMKSDQPETAELISEGTNPSWQPFN